MPTSSNTPVFPLEGRYDLGAFFDEMFDAAGHARPHYRALAEQLAALSVEEFEQRRHAVDVSFLNQGIGFTVYGEEEGLERIFPFDLIPRVIPAGRVGAHRARGDPARARAQPLPRRRLPRAADPARRANPGRARVRRDALPPRDDRPEPAHRRVRARRGRRHRARRARRVPRARGQPALALRRQLHAREPRRDEARVRTAVRALRRARHRPVPAGAARGAAQPSHRRPRRCRRSSC